MADDESHDGETKGNKSLDETDFGEVNINGLLAVLGGFILNMNFGSLYSWGAFILY